jgi:hypothetical protein
MRPIREYFYLLQKCLAKPCLQAVVSPPAAAHPSQRSCCHHRHFGIAPAMLHCCCGCSFSHRSPLLHLVPHQPCQGHRLEGGLSASIDQLHGACGAPTSQGAGVPKAHVKTVMFQKVM